VSILLEVLGKGLETNLLSLVLPGGGWLTAELEEARDDIKGAVHASSGEQLRQAIAWVERGAEDKAAALLDKLLKTNPEAE